MQNTLVEICETIDSLVQNPDAHIYASSYHALDESLLFGTTDAYLRFASELLKFIVASQCNEVDVAEHGELAIQTSDSISGVFDLCSEIVFENSGLVQTEAEARQLCDYLNDLQQGSILTHHGASYEGEGFQNCDFTNVELTNCKTKGMRINGILLQDLLDKHHAQNS